MWKIVYVETSNEGWDLVQKKVSLPIFQKVTIHVSNLTNARIVMDTQVRDNIALNFE